MQKNKYKISELANILGVSEVAIRKKIKDQRYKQRYDVITENVNNKQVAFILLDYTELEEEKRLAYINKNKFSQQNVSNNVTENVEETDYIDVAPENIDEENISENSYITLTKLYIDKLENVYERLTQSESEQKLLTDKAGREGLYLQEIKDLNNVVNRRTKWLVTLSICSLLVIISMSFMLMYQHFNPKTVEKEKQVTKVITLDKYGKPVSVLTEKQ